MLEFQARRRELRLQKVEAEPGQAQSASTLPPLPYMFLGRAQSVSE
jgi:hypothetical protein